MRWLLQGAGARDPGGGCQELQEPGPGSAYMAAVPYVSKNCFVENMCPQVNKCAAIVSVQDRKLQ